MPSVVISLNRQVLNGLLSKEFVLLSEFIKQSKNGKEKRKLNFKCRFQQINTTND